MIIEELQGGGEVASCVGVAKGNEVALSAKRVLVGAGARALFYPTLFYNVVRNKIQSEFRWWDKVDEFIMLGAVPFPADVPQLKDLGVHGVVTLNESYETLVPSSLYHAHGIDHLVIPTRDYCFAPSLSDICHAVEFIHVNVSNGRTTYVHCKAGRGRSTTIVVCYLVRYMRMMPDAAYDYVRSIRPRVLLASAQWKAVKEYYHHHTNKNAADIPRMVMPKLESDVKFDDSSVIVVMESDLDGYEQSLLELGGGQRSKMAASESSTACQVLRGRLFGHALLARLSSSSSGVWLRCIGRRSTLPLLLAGHSGGISVEISVC